MHVLKDPKCGRTRSGLEEQRGEVGIPGRARSSSTPTVSSYQRFPPFPMCYQHKALGSPCFSLLRRQPVITARDGFIVLSLCLCFQVAGTSQVKRSQETLAYKPGDEAELIFSVTPSQDVTNMQITVNRSDEVAHLYEDGKDKPESSSRFYSGRTKLVKSNMPNGTVTLRLCHLQPSDSGWYRCVFRNGSFYYETVIELRVAAAASFITPLTITVSTLAALLILILTGRTLSRKMLKSWHKNRSKSQPSPCHRTSQATQLTYLPAPSSDPAADDLDSVVTDGSANTAAAMADTHDAVLGEASTNPTEDPYPSDAATMDTCLTADSGSTNAYDSEAHNSAHSHSCDSASLGAGPRGSAGAAYATTTEVHNQLLCKHDSQEEVELADLLPDPADTQPCILLRFGDHRGCWVSQ